MALLVRFPLRINQDGGRYSIDDPAALQSRFQELFPATVRNAVLNRKPTDVSCMNEGIMYGNGDVWVTQTKLGFEIKVINLPTLRDPKALHAAIKVEFVCRTERHRILIDSDAEGLPRYRSWNIPRSIIEKSDLEIAKGHKEIEGTDGCTHVVWAFKNDTTTYTVEELGCFPDTNQPPEGARGVLEVMAADKPETSSWCF